MLYLAHIIRGPFDDVMALEVAKKKKQQHNLRPVPFCISSKQLYVG